MKKNKKKKLYRLPVKLCKTFILYLIMLPLSFIFTQALKNSASAVLFVFICVLPLADYLYLIISLLTVRFDIETEGKVTRLEPVELNIRKKNYSFLPVPHAYVQLSLPRGVGCEVERVRFSLSPFERGCARCVIYYEYRGQYRVGIDSVYVRSLLGFFRISLNYRIMKNVTVAPRRLRTAHIDGTYCAGDGSVTVSDSGEDPAGVRDYVPGDSMRKIHWKLSAKGDDLLVKQYDGEGEKRTVIIPDMYADGEEAVYRTEAVCETVLGICRQLCETGKQVTVCCEGKLIEANSAVGYERLYESVCALRPGICDTYCVDGGIYVTADPTGLMERLPESSEPGHIFCVVHGQMSSHTAMLLSRLKQADIHVTATDENGGEICL